MNIKLFVMVACAVILMTSACQKEDDGQSETISRTYSVSFSEMSEMPEPVWNPGNQLYFADDYSSKSGTQVVASDALIADEGTNLQATFKTISRKAGKVYAISAENAWIRQWKSTFSFVYDGTFAGAAIGVGETGVDASSLVLSPLMGVAEFEVGMTGVTSVKFTTDKEIFPVKMTYNFKEKKMEVTSKCASLTLNIAGAGKYYVPIVPGERLTGCTVEMLNQAGMFLATETVAADDTAVAGSIISIGDISQEVEDLLDPDIPQSESAATATKNMGVGLNLCATLEELPYDGYNKADRNNPFTFENMYSAEINQLTMTTFASAGFKSVRIPVTWFLHMDDPGSKIDDVWLDRVEEIVNYALNAGLYCILNLHHDSGQHEEKGSWLFADWKNYESISADFKNVWTQIATRFKDYDYRLLFESFNELLDENKSWFVPTSENGYKAANALNQDFVNTVRQTGGHNATRNLVVTTYSASTYEVALKAFVMPDDLLPDHLITQIHSYLPAKFVTAKADHREEFYESDIEEIDAMFALVNKYIVEKGYPCILGEYGAYPRKKDDGSINNEHNIHRGHHAGVYVRRSLKHGIAPMYWYNPMETYHYKWGKWTHEPVKDSLINAYNKHIESLK